MPPASPQGGQYKREDIALRIAAAKITPFVERLKTIFVDAGFTSASVEESPNLKKEQFIYGDDVTPDIVDPALRIVTRELEKNPFGTPQKISSIVKNALAFSLKLESCNRSIDRNTVKKGIYFDPELGCHMTYTAEEASQRKQALAPLKMKLRRWPPRLEETSGRL